jgi:membrane-associated phospholipid phosphatase
MPALLVLALLAQSPDPPPNEPATLAPPALDPGKPAGPNALAFSWPIDVSIGGGLSALWLVSEFGVKKNLAPGICHWCGHNALDDSIRRAFVPAGTLTFDGVHGPDVASNVMAFVVAPALVLGLDALMAQSLKSWVQDAVIVVEAVMAAMVADQIVKFAVGRQRPFVSELTPSQQAMTRDPADNNLSFFSGHATWTAAFAVAGGLVALQRGYKYPWLIWLFGGAASVATSVLRIAADKHYFTDVLVGTLAGAGFGIALPLVFHRAKVEASVGPGGMTLQGRF